VNEVKTARIAHMQMVALATLAAFSSAALPARADPPVAPVASASPETPAPPAPPSPPPGPSRATVTLGAAGVAIAGAIGATVFGVLALQNKSDYEKTPTYSNTDNGNNFAAYSDGCIALAVAAGITSLVLYLTNPSSADPVGAPSTHAAALAPAPLVTARAAGAGAILRF
jgi:hypothetical protein